MAYRFFIQLYPQDGQTYSAVNLEDKFDCLFMKFTNLANTGDVKNTYTENFIEEDGQNTFTPNHADVRFSTFECTLDVLFRKGDVLKKSTAFFNYIRGHLLEYHDTFRNKYAQLLCTKQPQIGEEKLYGYTKYQKVTYTFTNVRGRTYGSSQLNFEEKLKIKLSTDTLGQNVYIDFIGRGLGTNERVVLMRCGKNRSRKGNHNGRVRSRHRWIYPNFATTYNNIPSQGNNQVLGISGRTLTNLPEWEIQYRSNDTEKIAIRKSGCSKLLVPWKSGAKGVCTFGVTVIGMNKDGHSRRISNVCYVRVHVEVTGESHTESSFKQWYAVK